jgi:son of sevenless-like protein
MCLNMFAGLFLTDLTFIEDGNSNMLRTAPHLINFDKRSKTADKIREVQQYQNIPYTLREVQELQHFLIMNLEDSQRDVEELYQTSLQIEPREREDEKISRLLEQSGFL